MYGSEGKPATRFTADVKCYHCGHISGQVEGTRAKRLFVDTFRPRPGFQGAPPETAARLRCERCGGPVYLEDIRAIPAQAEPISLPARAAKKRAKTTRSKAA